MNKPQIFAPPSFSKTSNSSREEESRKAPGCKQASTDGRGDVRTEADLDLYLKALKRLQVLGGDIWTDADLRLPDAVVR